MTRGLCEGRQVVAVELDGRVLPLVGEWAPAAEVLHADALAVDWGEILAGLPAPRGIVSNMPYQISSLLLAKVGEVAGRIDRAVLMMQKEVGEKVCAAVGDRRRGSLSVAMQRLFRVSRVCDVPPGAFLPPPRVESVVLELRPTGEGYPAGLERFVRAGFGQPRKTVANNLREMVGRALAEEVLGESGMGATSRPHELPFEVWARLWQAAGEGDGRR